MNSIDPCDPELQNEDNKMRHSIIDAVGCIPAFSRPFLDTSLLRNDSSMYPTCSRVQYKGIYKLYENFLQTKDWFTQPCTRMNALVATSDSITETNEFRYIDFQLTLTNGDAIEFILQYQTESYRETINNLAFDMATLWSQIGGFIGMFLGFSLLQVTQLSGNVLRKIKSFF